MKVSKEINGRSLRTNDGRLLKICHGTLYGLICCASFVTLVWLLNWGYRWIKVSPIFDLKEIHVSSGSRVKEKDILKLARIGMGQNIFTLDLEKISKRIESHPWVQSAEIRRLFLDRLAISVVERKALAVVGLRGSYYLIDSKGNLFQRVEDWDRKNFILITGISKEEIAEGGGLSIELLWKAIDLIPRLKRSSFGRISQIDLRKGSGLTLRVLDGRVLVFLGQSDYHQRLEHLSKLLRYLAQNGGVDRLKYVYLNYKGMAIVKMNKKGSNKESL